MTKRARILEDVLWAVVVVGAVAIGFRLYYGLGATTHLTDGVPWGLWKILNMVAGVALATGGFTVGLLVYVLGIERLRPLLRPAILVAFLGYGSSVFALMIDIGLPHRIWHPFLMWNPRSFLFEVAMCVAFYFTTTIVEMSPTIAESYPRWHAWAHRLHRATPAIVILGITLSSLHHTSLGSLFLVTPARLHPLWYTGWLPVLFITSAMGAGMMVTVLVWMLWSWLFDPAPVFGKTPERWIPQVVHETEPEAEGRDLPMLRTLATIAAGVLTLYLVLKLVDLVRTRAVGELLTGSWESLLYMAELALTAVVPPLLLAIPAVRRQAAGIAFAATSAALGMALNRMSVGIFGYFEDAKQVYFPSVAEWAICLGVIAAAGLALMFIGRHFAVFGRPIEGDTPGIVTPLERVLLIAVFVVPLAWAGLYPPFHDIDAAAAAAVAPPRAPDLAREVLVLDANRGDLRVAFPHAEHRARAEEDGTCSRCHHLALPGDNATPCSRCHARVWSATEIFDHDAHLVAVARREELRGAWPRNLACEQCHPAGRTRHARTVKGCAECHDEDMKPARMPDDRLGLASAPGYLPAVHETCLSCHEEKARTLERPKLAECANCHADARKDVVPPSEQQIAATGAANSVTTR